MRPSFYSGDSPNVAVLPPRIPPTVRRRRRRCCCRPCLFAAPLDGFAVQDLAGAVVAAPGVLRPEGEKLDPLKFAEIAKKDYGIDAVEYVNQFYKDKKKDEAYLKDLKKVADDDGRQERPHHVRRRRATSATRTRRSARQAVENHYRWVEWAKFLGCHSHPRQRRERPAEGLREENAEARRRRPAQAHRVRRQARRSTSSSRTTAACRPTASGSPA